MRFYVFTPLFIYLFIYLFKIAEDVDLNELAEMTEGFSGSGLKEMCK